MTTQTNNYDPSNFLVSPGLFAKGGIHIIAGSPYAGKSTLITQFLKCFLTGTTFIEGLQFQQIPINELGIIFTDRRSFDNNVWLHKEGLDQIPAYSIVDDDTSRHYVLSSAIANNTQQAETHGVYLFDYCLSKLREQSPLVKYVFADVFTNTFTGPNIQNQHTVYTHMYGLLQICRKRDVTLFGTAYGSKQKTGKQDRYLRLVDRIIGAVTLRGSATDMLYITTKEETALEDRQQLQWCSRHGAERTITLIRNADGFFVQDESITVPPEEEPREAIPRRLRNAIEQLLPHIPFEPIDKQVLMEALVPSAFSRPSFFNYLKDLESHGYIEITIKTVRRIKEN